MNRIALIALLASVAIGTAQSVTSVTNHNHYATGTLTIDGANIAAQGTNIIRSGMVRIEGDAKLTHGSLVRIVSRGDVCAVYQHQWGNMIHATLEYRPSGDYPQHRKCSLCGKVETKEPGVWR
jgi:hypothetical protein